MKKIYISNLAIIFSAFIFLGFAPMNAHSKTKVVTIGTGGITGVYYPAGGAIAKMVSKKSKEYGFRATVESTDGSVFNINAIMEGEFEFGIVQSDRQYEAAQGLEEWKKKGPQKDLRAVFSIHPEILTLLATADSGIKTIKDIKGKRINIGNPGSGQHQNSIDALTAVGFDYKKDIKAEEANVHDASELLQKGQLDAFFYTVGHPSEAFKEATTSATKVRFVSISGHGIDKFIEEKPYYTKSVIPIELYVGAANKADVDSFGVKATFVTSVKIPAHIVYAITKEVFENFEEFKQLHPAFKSLTKKGMLEGLSAPIHPGAVKYYKESGLMK